MTETRWDGPGLDAWDAWRPERVAELLAGTTVPWCVVGGWAIDLYLGRETRTHEDLEIAIPRHGFSTLRTHLAGYRLHEVNDGSVRALADDESPSADAHQNWVLDVDADAWRMDVMLEPSDADTWRFRRDPHVQAPRARMVGYRDRIPYLRPEGVLLFKAKAVREKDERDFAACLAVLDDNSRGWLAAALARVHHGHHWIEQLRNG